MLKMQWLVAASAIFTIRAAFFLAQWTFIWGLRSLLRFPAVLDLLLLALVAVFLFKLWRRDQDTITLLLAVVLFGLHSMILCQAIFEFVLPGPSSAQNIDVLFIGSVFVLAGWVLVGKLRKQS